MRVLLAEDDDGIREGLAEVLEREGWEVWQAADGREALARADGPDGPPEIAVLDIMMPELDGYGVCRELRAKHPDVGILFLSAKGEELDQVLGLELGADDFVTKPFRVREVLARIKAVARRTAQRPAHAVKGAAAPDPDRPPERFRMGDLEVRSRELRAYRDGDDAPIDLGPRDVRILALLWAERGNAVDRQQMMDVCWGRDYLPSSRTLDQHISQLRKRVERDPKAPELIRTVHGVGYRHES